MSMIPRMLDLLKEADNYEVTLEESEADSVAEHLLDPRESQEKVFHQLGRWRSLRIKT